MKLKHSIILGVAAALSLSGCSDWLDVNDNPNSATNEQATYYQRLAHIEFYTNSAYQFAGMRTNMGLGDWTMSSRTSAYGKYAQWEMSSSPVTTPYQWWFVGAASNLEDMISSAEEAGAWHYVGVAHIIKAYGFMLMTDLYGEMPYTEALTNTNTPKYDTGRTIFKGCLEDLDLGIEYLSKQQDEFAQSLASGDYWAGGDVSKWIKMAYLLKARCLNHLIKKGAGSASDLKYDAQTILDCLAKAEQSNSDNVVIKHTDDNGATHDVLGWDEPVDYSPLYSVIGMNSNYYVTQMLVDNFTNFGGYGVEDPRADHIIPWCRSTKSDTTPEGIVFKNGWRRSVGLDMNTTIRTTGAPYTTSWNSTTGNFYCNSSTRAGDTIYVHQTSSSKGYASNTDLFYYRDGKKGKGNANSAMSGTFYTRVSSPTFIATYHEACFIKAEVLFNQGKTAEAFEAYKNGIRANIELMNEKLKEWVAEDANLASCPSFTPIEQADIDNYIENGIGTASDLTLGKIMTQKHMAMMFSVEQWNDMRRYDYDENIFLNWHIPAEYYINTTAQSQIPLGKQLRRWIQCSHETNYNSTNLNAIGSEVPGADTSLAAGWQSASDIWTVNIWWDSTQE
jgi:hypothetical protein